MIELLSILMLIAIAILACVFITIFVREIQKQKQKPPSHSYKSGMTPLLHHRQITSKAHTNRETVLPSQPSFSQTVSASTKTDGKIKRSTRDHLFRLVNGNQETADRLVRHSREKYPDKSEQWRWEKVIFDLERDRS